MCAVAFAEKVSHHQAAEDLVCEELLTRETALVIESPAGDPSEVFQQAMECFQLGLRAQVQLKEESAARCASILHNAGSPLEWEKSLPAKVAKAIETARQEVAQSIRSIDKKAEKTVRLMETALRLHRLSTPASEEISDYWTYAVHAMRANTQIMYEANARVLESWDQLAAEALNRLANTWRDSACAAN